MRVTDVYIAGLGSYVPSEVPISQAVAEGRYPADEVEQFGLGGAVVAGEMPAPDMALIAGQEAFKRCGLNPRDTDLLLYPTTWFHGPDGWLPQTYLQRYLVGGDALAVEVRHGCAGFFSSLELAASYLRADSGRRIALVLSADNYGTPRADRWLTAPGFVLGDAASAVVLSTEPGFAQLLSVGTATVPEAEDHARAGEPLFPPASTVGRTPDFRARRVAVATDSSIRQSAIAIMAEVHRKMAKLFRATMDEAGITIDDVTRIASVNISRELLNHRGMTALGLDMSKDTWEFGRNVGHCGPADQFLSFDHLVSTGQLRPGDHLLLLGTGPGVVLNCAVIKILEPAPWLDSQLDSKGNDTND
jgi:3-oxoacyl-[acyl-carrier-protein] synthase-3/clorobiocin biosynthesis protein CloN2